MIDHNIEPIIHETFFCEVRGWSVIIPKPDSEFDWTLYDFNPAEVRRAALGLEPLPGNTSLHLGPHVLEGSTSAQVLDVLQGCGNIQTELPYRKILLHSTDVCTTMVKKTYFENDALVFLEVSLAIFSEAYSNECSCRTAKTTRRKHIR